MMRDKPIQANPSWPVGRLLFLELRVEYDPEKSLVYFISATIQSKFVNADLEAPERKYYWNPRDIVTTLGFVQ